MKVNALMGETMYSVLGQKQVHTAIQGARATCVGKYPAHSTFHINIDSHLGIGFGVACSARILLLWAVRHIFGTNFAAATVVVQPSTFSSISYGR